MSIANYFPIWDKLDEEDQEEIIKLLDEYFFNPLKNTTYNNINDIV